MASTLTNFLVGIGWDTRDFDKGARNVETSLKGVGKTVLQVGAAMVGAFGAKALTVEFAKRTDEINLFSRAIGVSTENVQGLGNAFAVAGGEFESGIAVLQKLTDAKDALLVKGEAGFLTDMAYAGIDPQALLQSKDAYGALLNIIRDFDKLSPEKQRTLVQTLGLGPAEIALFKQGRNAVEQQIEMLKKMRPATADAEDAARKFRGQWALFGVQAGGIADQISTPLVAALADSIEYVNLFIGANKPIIDGTIAKAVGFVGDNFKELAVAVALVGAGATMATISRLATFIPIIGTGLGTIAAMAARLSYIGLAITGGAMAWDAKPEDIEKLTGWKPPEWLFTPVDELPKQSKKTEEAVKRSSGRAASLGIDTRVTPIVKPSASRATTQNAPTKQAPLTIHLNLDGRVLDERITNVTERNNTLTLEDVTTTTKR